MLGANVYSFDYDPHSVACTAELKRRYFPDDQWVVERGSVLDREYLSNLGQFDVVYSWGVLHHTGNMWDALGNVAQLVQPGGRIFIAIYNKQQFFSNYWILVKQIYNKLWGFLKVILNYIFFTFFALLHFNVDLMQRKNPALRYYGVGKRGMTLYYDVIDWIGGWPFEVASPEEIFIFFRDKNFRLIELVTCGGKHGCNEFVFESGTELL